MDFEERWMKRDIEDLQKRMTRLERWAGRPWKDGAEVDEFERVLLADDSVYQMVSGGLSLEQVVVGLVGQKQKLLERITQLEHIAPKRIKGPDGDLIWRCPDEWIPLQD